MKKGFYCTIGNKAFFLISDQAKRTQAAVYKMIEGIARFKGFSDDQIKTFKSHAATYKDIQYNMSPAVLEKRTTDSGTVFYNISGRGFSCSYPADDFKNDVAIIGGAL